MQPSRPPADPARPQRFPRLVPFLTLAFFAFVLVPPVRGSASLTWSFVGVGAFLLVWQSLLWFHARRSGRILAIDRAPVVRAHYIQACVQLSIYAYWGWYWRPVYAAIPLILGQLVFLYVFDALLSWSRGRDWRLGFGPLPIVLSTNLFMWFKDDWFVLQFVMVAAGALGKEFIKWNREGRKTHVFNPSAFALCLVSIFLIATGTTYWTWGEEVATTLGRPPHIYIEIFLLGLVVQYFFSVTLMTLSAGVVLYVLNVVYTGQTGLYQFVDTNIPIAVFLGLHLLMTDPSTSPRTSVGRVIFGGLYGLANFVLFDVLARAGIPEFYDKLLPVPFLNLSVRLLDRIARSPVLVWFDRFEARFAPKKRNLVQMACWTALFATMLATGFVGPKHEGASIDFWKRAHAEGRPDAGWKLVKVVGSQALAGSAPACNEFGEMHMRGELVAYDRAAAGHYFAIACEAGDLDGCANLAAQFLFLREARSNRDVALALGRLEHAPARPGDGRLANLVGFAYETGRGRPRDEARALALYEQGCAEGNLDACRGLVRIRCGEKLEAGELEEVARTLEASCEAGDAESCFYLSYLCHHGKGVRQEEAMARVLLEKACALGSAEACEALREPVPPAPRVPVSLASPGWLSAALERGRPDSE